MAVGVGRAGEVVGAVLEEEKSHTSPDITLSARYTSSCLASLALGLDDFPKLPMPCKAHAHCGECAHQIEGWSQHIMCYQCWLVGEQGTPID